MYTINIMKHSAAAPFAASNWWDHETDRSQLVQLSSANAELVRAQYAAGWRRNGNYALLMVLAVAVGYGLRVFLV